MVLILAVEHACPCSLDAERHYSVHQHGDGAVWIYARRTLTPYPLSLFLTFFDLLDLFLTAMSRALYTPNRKVVSRWPLSLSHKGPPQPIMIPTSMMKGGGHVAYNSILELLI